MARGQESKKIVDDFIKELNSSNEFLMTMIPCIIPNNEEDKQLLESGLKVITQIDSFIKECDGSLADLDELFDIDKIVSDYPKIKTMFNAVNLGSDADDEIENILAQGDSNEG